MEDLINEFEKIKSEYYEVDNEKNHLEEYKVIKKYLLICSKRDLLLGKYNELEKKVRIEKYKKCKHVLVETYYDYDSYEGRSYHYYGCIKCGLDESVWIDNFAYNDTRYEMRNILKGKIKGTKLGVACNLNLAMPIYNKLKKENPDMPENILLSWVRKEIKDQKEKTYKKTR